MYIQLMENRDIFQTAKPNSGKRYSYCVHVDYKKIIEYKANKTKSLHLSVFI